MKERGSDLLRDLAALLKRHPSRDWTLLADLLENGDARSQAILFLRGIAAAKQTPGKPTRQKAGVAKLKSRPRNTKKEYLERLDLDLSRRSTSELRELARRRGLNFSTKDSKQRLIGKLSRISPGSAPKSTRPLETPSEGSGDYAQWAEIILGRDKR